MKRTISYFGAIVLLFSLLGGLGACKEEKRYKIGIAQCSEDAWRRKMNDEVRREMLFHPEAEVEIRSADDNNEKQIADIRYFMDNNFDIIIAAPNEADAITPIIKEVYDSGKPVIVFDRSINGDTYTAFQGADNFGIGEAAARYAHNLVGDNGKVIEIYGLKGSTPAIQRHLGFFSGADKYGLDVVESVYGNWNPELAGHLADSLLNIHPDVDVIYAHNDLMAIAASETARKKGLKVKVIGIDAAPEIGVKAVADSVIDATFLYPTEGYGLIRTALAILEGKPYDKVSILPVSSAVDKSNADILLKQNDMLQEETSKIQLLKSEVEDYWKRHSEQTTLFYTSIAMVVVLFVLLFAIMRTYRVRRRHQKVLEEQNQLLAQQRDNEIKLNEQLEKATQSKLMFFTNVSHDLRTPLTLIAEPVEQLEEADYLTPQHHALMKIANKNVKILRRLINQILDFRKYENGKMGVNLQEVHIAGLMRDWTESFTAIARTRDIKLTIDIHVDPSVTVAIDTEMIERVVFNLMSNAFRYTSSNGKIHLVCTCDDRELRFSVADTGQGIPPGEIDNIFGRFYQVDKISTKGSGIGLSLAKAFVELHEGSIEVESEVGKGTKFTVTLPVRHVEMTDTPDPAQTITDKDVSTELGDIELEGDIEDTDKPLVLLIDDNADIRKLIRELVADRYRVIEARNGKDGIRLASKYVPDLIICDIMMPVMDGLECCRRIKSELSTSHIPVLMLTACSMDEQRIQSYESGADGYLSKPFSSDMLKKRCENLIENRKRIKNVAGAAGIASGAAGGKAMADDMPAPGDIDNEFYARLMEMINEQMGNPDLNIETLASKMGIGRSQFYRKIKALTNYSPVELLRKIRLTKARELLSTTERPISEIAYEVGFSAPAYFSRVFREMFDESPTELRTRLGIKD